MKTDAARFYGPSQGQPLGTGLIVRDCVIAAPHPAEVRFETGIGLGLIITHECDADQNNNRFFNDLVLVCLIISLDNFCIICEEEEGVGAWGGILPAIASDIVYRAMYLPPLPAGWPRPMEMEGGGIIYLNHISPSRVHWFKDVAEKAICTLSAIGLRAFDFKLKNHLFREKATELWFTR